MIETFSIFVIYFYYKIFMKVDFIPRPQYLKKVEPFINKNIIKVFVGQRRVGKSYIMYQAIDFIQNTNKNANIVYINKELDEFSSIIDAKSLLNYVKQRVIVTQPNYLFIDEIQDIYEFEKALRSLLAEGVYDIYCTGSNANLLSGELATFLSGRYIEIEVFSLSYIEYLDFYKTSDSDEALAYYLKCGGMPFLIHLGRDENVVFEYLRTIHQTILYRDIVNRFKIRNNSFLEHLLRYLGDNTGSLFSAKRISDFLKSQNIKITPQVVLNYLSYIVSACLIYKVDRTDIAGKRIFEVGEKYYFADIGIRNAIAGYKTSDINKIMENICFLHLRENGYNVKVGFSDNKEIDFICEKKNEKIYVQVCYMLTDKKTIDREFGNLLAIDDNYPKMVVSMDALKEGNTTQGIMNINLREFLINRI